MDSLTTGELSRVVLAYAFALIPLCLLLYLFFSGRLPGRLLLLYFLTIFICAIGWEVWFSFGLADGVPVEVRRTAALNAALPQEVHWLVHSMADGAVAMFGMLLIWLCWGRDDRALRRFHPGALLILLVWFLAQNIFRGLLVYQEQLMRGWKLSWAPLAPTGSFYNPVLLEIAGRSINLQSQMPWIFLVPIFYWLVLKLYDPGSPGMGLDSAWSANS